MHFAEKMVNLNVKCDWSRTLESPLMLKFGLQIDLGGGGNIKTLWGDFCNFSGKFKLSPFWKNFGLWPPEKTVFVNSGSKYRARRQLIILLTAAHFTMIYWLVLVRERSYIMLVRFSASICHCFSYFMSLHAFPSLNFHKSTTSYIWWRQKGVLREGCFLKYEILKNWIFEYIFWYDLTT